MEIKFHIPVMPQEIIKYLLPAPGKTIVDATTGTGGHSEIIAGLISPGGRLICLDRDESSLAIAKTRLSAYQGLITFVHSNFVDIDSALADIGVEKVDGIVFDLGMSTFQLEDPSRGLSFQKDGPLDMRFDRSGFISAYDLVNNLNEEELSQVLWTFGQERWHNRIARMVVETRSRHPITTTRQLSDIIVRAIPARFKHYRIHPATRAFQALRIAVNRELEAAEAGLNKSVGLLKEGGRICAISFHSLEDRIVKLRFKEFAAQVKIEIITPKPLIPSAEEARVNPASRSAKLRVAERI
ncbi:MAG: 16S rRNA (cytosine(1402)-N(4))-methyltransferase RsmH [Candidatus Omnitrophica bacterium]|nr:16S rRNA (cytosine(1402)-N(4))-methyltransferase RsmH [Candidatus Omnitrophota bacterium]